MHPKQIGDTINWKIHYKNSPFHKIQETLFQAVQDVGAP